MSKRFIVGSAIVGSAIAAFAVVFFNTHTVYAASESSYRGPNGGSPITQPVTTPALGLKDAYLVAYVSEQLNVSPEEISTKLESGLTLSQILIEYEVTDYPALIADAQAYAIQQLAEDEITMPGWQNVNRSMGMGGGSMMNRYGFSSR